MDTEQIQHFSHDIFHSHILPDLLSEYIHELLVNSKSQEWNPFLILPLVSRHFFLSCRILCNSIFGPPPVYEFDDFELTQSDHIREVLDCAKDSWQRANVHPSRAHPVEYMSQDELKASDSLFQVYICVATAKCYFNLDVLWNINLEQRRIAGEFDDVPSEERNQIMDGDLDAEMDMDVDMDMDAQDGQPSAPAPARQFRMRDDNMHRLFLPLTCAIQMCDQIRPARLAYIVANYLAEIIPLYTTTPLILKYAQDLEMYVSGEQNFDQDYLLFSIKQTLGLVDQTSPLLQMIQEKTGKLVCSFKGSRMIPFKTLCDTNILQALDKVVDADWGAGTEWINECTRIVKRRLVLAAA